MARKPAPVGAPWAPVPYDDQDIYAVKAVAAGNASEGQQKRFFDLVVTRISGTYDLSYRPGQDGDRDTVFAEGKRYVGLQLVKFLKLTPKQ